jgi:hypothetical protein
VMRQTDSQNKSPSGPSLGAAPALVVSHIKPHFTLIETGACCAVELGSLTPNPKSTRT